MALGVGLSQVKQDILSVLSAQMESQRPHNTWTNVVTQKVFYKDMLGLDRLSHFRVERAEVVDGSDWNCIIIVCTLIFRDVVYVRYLMF